MHTAAVSVAATPVAAGGFVESMRPTVAALDISASAFLYSPSAAVLWYMSENIDIEVEYEGIAIEAEQLIGVTTE